MDETITNTQEQVTPPPAVEPVQPSQDLEKYAQQIKELQSKAEAAESALKRREMEDLEKNQEWQKVAKIKEDEAKDISTKYDALKQATVKREKYNALAQSALSAGLRKESVADLRLIDFPELKIETTDEGDVLVNGTEKAIQRLKTLRPHWFQSATVNVNPTTPSTTSATTSDPLSKIRKLEAEKNKNPSKENIDALRSAILTYNKTGAC